MNTPDIYTLAASLRSCLLHRMGKSMESAQPSDWLNACAFILRDSIAEQWVGLQQWKTSKRVYYLSMEFLIGRLLRDAMSNLGMAEALRAALEKLGVSLDVIAELEPDAALGNGGLGRLAACFMESMASLNIPAIGYGIRYAHGMFRQRISEGWQAELPDSWLDHGNPWEFERRERTTEVSFGGSVENEDGRSVWHPQENFLAVAFDTPIVGWQGARINTLRLWWALPQDPILLSAFNAGDHAGALRADARARSLTSVLYPADATAAGQELRLRQEYFFSAASLQDILARHVREKRSMDSLPDFAAIQLNDTHPAVAVLELLRLLMDYHGLNFERAWDVTRAVCGYTNHTLLPEALESWPLPLFTRLLPRHTQIAYMVNAYALKQARSHGLPDAQVQAISVIDEQGERRLRMGNLAFLGSHAVNGVSALHSGLMKTTVFEALHALYPERIQNKTNGITPRRWLLQCNAPLATLIEEGIGADFKRDLQELRALERFAEDGNFLDRFAKVKQGNKERLSNWIGEQMGVSVDPSALFDMHIKRIHEYKRQLLNLIEVVVRYEQMRLHPERQWAPRVKFFGGKAAPSYHAAHLIIKLIHDVARVINADPATRQWLQIIFVPNYCVSIAERMIPAADLSEQISTAGLEASGTGNMKFALNGALTIGTMDGANIEMCEHIGAENLFIFGLSAQGVQQRRDKRMQGDEPIAQSPLLGQVLDAIANGVFSPDDPARYTGLIDSLRGDDWFMVAADFASYAACQQTVDELWRHPNLWHRRALLNTARMGWFSSDRTIAQYASEIWGVKASAGAGLGTRP